MVWCIQHGNGDIELVTPETYEILRELCVEVEITNRYRHAMDFVVREVWYAYIGGSRGGFGSDPPEPGRSFRWRYQKRDARTRPCLTDDRQDAEIWFHGSIRWDGCANFHFPEKGLHHICGESHIHRYAAAWAWLYERAETETIN